MDRKAWPLALILSLVALQAEGQYHHGPPATLPPDPAPQASDLTAEQLIAKCNAARGGEQKLKGVQSVKMTGTWETNQERASPVTLMMAPGRYMRRIERGGGAGTSVKAVNAEAAWEIAPQPKAKPTPMIAQDAARYRRMADPQGPLVNHQAKGIKVEVVGKMPWEGSQVYKLKVVYRDGGTSFLYLDAKSFLPVRAVGSMYIQQLNKDIDTEYVYEEYRDVNGVKWPFTEKLNAPEVNFKQTISWKTIEVNKPLDPAAFQAPKG